MPFLRCTEYTLLSFGLGGQPISRLSSSMHYIPQTITQFFAGIVWSLLNSCMRKHKKALTEKQFQINRRIASDTQLAKEWLTEAGLNADTFDATDIRLLQAQQQAHALLTHHAHLLSHTQRTALEQFQRAMANTRTRDRLKPSAANPVLNISSKINRQLFKQYRSMTQAQH
jgi:hypothetical protein